MQVLSQAPNSKSLVVLGRLRKAVSVFRVGIALSPHLHVNTRKNGHLGRDGVGSSLTGISRPPRSATINLR